MLGGKGSAGGGWSAAAQAPHGAGPRAWQTGHRDGSSTQRKIRTACDSQAAGPGPAAAPGLSDVFRLVVMPASLLASPASAPAPVVGVAGAGGPSAEAPSAGLALGAELHHRHHRSLVRLATLVTGDVEAAERIVRHAFVRLEL